MTVQLSPTVLSYVVGADGKSEDRVYTFDYSKFPEIIGGDTLVSSPAPEFSQSINPPTSAPVTINLLAVNDKQVQVEITGGTAATRYTLYCRAALASDVARRLTCRGILSAPPLGS